MKEPNYKTDGWCLDDGEKRHLESPVTFEIPDLEVRQVLEPGDRAQLLFRICVNSGDEEAEGSVERMWVIVRERIPGGYVGVLNNTPATNDEDHQLQLGTELPFEYRHIIDVRPGSEQSRFRAVGPVPISWPNK